MMKGAKIDDLILAGFYKMQYPMTRCYIRKFHPVCEATDEEDTSALAAEHGRFPKLPDARQGLMENGLKSEERAGAPG